jgi:hypothetical protein
LESAEVFEGPPEELASLMPDLDTSTWQLDVEQARAKRGGPAIYLVCHYAGVKSTVQLKIPVTATVCKVEGTRNGTYAGCAGPGTREGTPARQIKNGRKNGQVTE